MNELGKLFRKSPIRNTEKKTQREIAACEQKTTSEKANFRFSFYFKIRAKISRRKTTRFSAPLPVSA